MKVARILPCTVAGSDRLFALSAIHSAALRLRPEFIPLPVFDETESHAPQVPVVPVRQVTTVPIAFLKRAYSALMFELDSLHPDRRFV